MRFPGTGVLFAPPAVRMRPVAEQSRSFIDQEEETMAYGVVLFRFSCFYGAEQVAVKQHCTSNDFQWKNIAAFLGK